MVEGSSQLSGLDIIGVPPIALANPRDEFAGFILAYMNYAWYTGK